MTEYDDGMHAAADDSDDDDHAEAFTLRDYRSGDAPALAEVFREAVQTTGATAYDAAQVKVWSAFVDDVDAFATSLAAGWVRVACDAQGCIGFGQIDMPGHIAQLYTAPRATRQGVASAILDDLAMLGEAMGASKLTVDASHLARPLFIKRGFVEVAQEKVERGGVVFERFRMEAKLGR